MSHDSRICSCHQHGHEPVAAALSATLLVSGRPVNQNASVELLGTLDLENEIAHLRFDVIVLDDRDGIQSGTLSIELTELHALLAALAARYPLFGRRWPGPSN